ncbi:hypothetical protein V5799_032116 [Amblyomma americanum]|uniref:Uncharacterized protein n=1 Tax=Amblyomma americanum TaxID=6943 RepID=A0AAQ4DS40_AMBAM
MSTDKLFQHSSEGPATSIDRFGGGLGTAATKPPMDSVQEDESRNLKQVTPLKHPKTAPSKVTTTPWIA